MPRAKRLGISDWIVDDSETIEPTTDFDVLTDPSPKHPEHEIESADLTETGSVEEDAPDFEDVDAAMAWLEGLAAKQGVSEEELLTSPEDRSESPPDWIQESTPSEVLSSDEMSLRIDDFPEVPAYDDTQDITEISKTPGIASEEPIEKEPEMEPDFDDVDAAMAWLESLAAKQGVSEDELLTRPEDRSETPPDWVLDTVEDDLPVTSADTDVIPEETETEDLTITQSGPVETAPSEVEEDISFTPPSWITDGQVPEDEDLSWLPTDDSFDESQLLDLNLASLIQLERLPGIGFRRAQSITAFREENGEFQRMDDLLNVPGMDHDTLELLKTRVAIITPEQSPEIEVFPHEELFDPQDIEPDDAIHELQLDAQNKLNDGKVEEAIDGYSEIINKGQRLNNVINDLNKAADKFPEEMSIVQTLGDAYLKANMLQEALDAYTKAENLLK